MGLVAIFDKDHVYLVNPHTQDVALTGDRQPNKLWMIKIKPISNDQEQYAVQQANQTLPMKYCNAVSQQKLDSAGDRVEFFSRTFCSPAESALINAVAKKWIKIPVITVNVLKRYRHRLRTHQSAAGHLDQLHQNQRQDDALRALKQKVLNALDSTTMDVVKGPEDGVLHKSVRDILTERLTTYGTMTHAELHKIKLE